MKPLFADTFYWIALADSSDSFHAKAREFSRSITNTTIVTTDEVLGEFLTYFAKSGKPGRLAAVGLVEHLLESRSVTVLPQGRESFRASLALYRARLDKGYSFADCISMQAMRAAGLTDALTNDIHFEQEGFRALFRP